MKYLKKFETNSQFNAWRNANPELNPYACFSMESGITYYQPFINTNGHAYVDLGLPSGTLWATMNIGAPSSSDVGSLFAWGEVETKESYTFGNYAWASSGTTAFNYDASRLTKYNLTDGLLTLEPEDDAAHVLWGGEWKIPTNAQREELVNYVESVLVDGVIVCTSTINGNTISFKPGGESSAVFSCSDIPSQDYPQHINYASSPFGDGALTYSNTVRIDGVPVRPVIGTLDVFYYQK